MKNILVVDDQSDVREATADALAQAGFVVHQAKDGETAWLAMREHMPDLVVLDIDMPGMSGLDVLKRIRGTEMYRSSAVIMLTADSRRSTVVEAIRLGAVDYVVKPIDGERLVIKVQRALAVSELQQKQGDQGEQSVIQLSRRDGLAIFTLKGPVNESTALQFQKRLTASLRMQLKGDRVILDLRHQPGFTGDQLQALNMLMAALEQEPFVLAGRNYYALLKSVSNPEQNLFISEDDIERHLKVRFND